MVECVITINGERTMFSTGFKVNPNQWDTTKQRVRGKDEETLIINDSLQAIHNKLYEKALELTQKGLFITADLLRDAYFNKVGCLQSRTLLSEFQAYIDERRPFVISKFKTIKFRQSKSISFLSFPYLITLV